MLTLATPAADLAAASGAFDWVLARLSSRRRSAPTTNPKPSPTAGPKPNPSGPLSLAGQIAGERTSAAARLERDGRGPRARRARPSRRAGGRKARPCTSTSSSTSGRAPCRRSPAAGGRDRSRSGRACGRRAAPSRSAVHDERRPRQQRRIVARRAPPPQQRRRQAALHEDPLHLGVGIAQQRAHECPVSPRIETDSRHRPAGAARPLRRRPAHRAAVGREAQHRRRRADRPPVLVDARSRRCRRRARSDATCARPNRRPLRCDRSPTAAMPPGRSRSTARAARTTAPTSSSVAVVACRARHGAGHGVAVAVERQARPDAGASRRRVRPERRAAELDRQRRPGAPDRPPRHESHSARETDVSAQATVAHATGSSRRPSRSAPGLPCSGCRASSRAALPGA